MRIVLTNQPKETYIAPSDRPETGLEPTSVARSADSDQFDQSPNPQHGKRKPFDRLDFETGARIAFHKSNEKRHPELLGIVTSQSVNSPELRELVEAVFGLADRLLARHGWPSTIFSNNWSGARVIKDTGSKDTFAAVWAAWVVPKVIPPKDASAGEWVLVFLGGSGWRYLGNE